MIQASSLVSIGTTAGHDPLEELAALGGHGETRFFFLGFLFDGHHASWPFFFASFCGPQRLGFTPWGCQGAWKVGGRAQRRRWVRMAGMPQATVLCIVGIVKLVHETTEIKMKQGCACINASKWSAPARLKATW